jgi:hypothetical protein
MDFKPTRMVNALSGSAVTCHLILSSSDYDGAGSSRFR